jgi:hypothetical protein
MGTVSNSFLSNFVKGAAIQDLLIQDRDACGGILRKGQKSWKALVEVYSN